jgi:hypothetical protein
MLREKFDWKQRVKVVEEPEELDWDPRLARRNRVEKKPTTLLSSRLPDWMLSWDLAAKTRTMKTKWVQVNVEGVLVNGDASTPLLKFISIQSPNPILSKSFIKKAQWISSIHIC